MVKRRGAGLDHLRSDLRAALRSLARYPVAAVVAIVSLGGGVGAATATLALRDTLYNLPPPLYAQPDALTVVRLDSPARARAPVPASLYRLWFDRGIDGVTLAAAAAARPTDLRLADRVETTMTRAVTPDLFRVLGVGPVAGQGFHDRPLGGDEPPQAMLSHRQWRTLFDGRPDAIGSTIWLNGVAHVVIGVLPEHFWYTQLSEPVWTRMDLDGLAADAALDVVGRRDAGASPAVLREHLQALANEHVARLPAEARHDLRVRADAMIGTPIGEAMGPMPGWLVSAAVFFTLVIGCTNVAVLMMAQWASREHELAVRASIGATRGRLVRTLVTESMLIAVAGGALGVAVTLALRGLIVRNGGEFTAFNLSIRPSVFLVTAAITAAAGLLTGFAPALHEARRSTLRPLGGLRGSDRVRQRWRHGLVAFEIATTVGLLVVIGALVSASQRAMSEGPGYDLAPLVTLRVQNAGGVDVARTLARLSELPGVVQAAASSSAPVGGPARSVAVTGAAREALPHRVEGADIGDGFFATLGVAVRQGRDVETADRIGPSRVALVNQVMASVLWPSQDSVVGRTIRVDGREHDVIGVVADFGAGPLTKPRPMVFLPLSDAGGTDVQFLVRSDGPGGRVRDLVRREVGALAPGNVVTRTVALQDIAHVAGQEILATAAPLLPLVSIAILLAAAGIYGILTFAVTRRGRELAIRMAVGATRAQVVWAVAGHSLAVVGVGLAGGVITAFALTRLARGSGGVFDSPGAGAFLVPMAIVLLVSALATWVPARRATHIDPARLLRLADG